MVYTGDGRVVWVGKDGQVLNPVTPVLLKFLILPLTPHYRTGLLVLPQ